MKQKLSTHFRSTAPLSGDLNPTVSQAYRIYWLAISAAGTQSKSKPPGEDSHQPSKKSWKRAKPLP